MKFLEIYNTSNKSKKKIEEALGFVYAKIMKLSTYTLKFDKKRIKKFINVIKKDLTDIEKMKTQLLFFSSPTKNLFINVHDRYNDVINIVDSIFRFYEFYLVNKYTNSSFKVLYLKIREELMELNLFASNDLNNEQIIKKFNIVNELIYKFLNLITQIYKYDVFLKHMNDIIGKFSNYSNVYENNEEKFIKIKQQIIIGENAIKNIKLSLANLEFENIRSHSIIAQNSLERQLIDLIKAKKINNFVREEINELVIEIDKFLASKDSVFSLIGSLDKKIGQKDAEINESLQLLKKDVNAIAEMNKTLKQEFVINENTDEEYMNFIVLLIEKVFNWKNKLNE
ncbi:MAG: hypothetical protein LBT02_03995, partial [Rickettsiales bacterium]|nr:hypothetical protein [Rickettsiales bacterium]